MKSIIVCGCMILGGCAYGGGTDTFPPYVPLDAGEDSSPTLLTSSKCGSLNTGSTVISEVVACGKDGGGSWTTYTCDDGMWRSAISHCH
jgi:hypothetical protein